METYNRDRHIHGVEEYEEQRNSSTGRDFSIGLVLGLLAGTVGGLLLAPKSGDDLRDEIQGQADKLTKNISGEGDEPSFKAQAEQKTAELRDKISQKKSEYEEKERIKDIDEDEMKAQQRAIKDDVQDSGADDARSVDMSKYDESSEEDK